MLCDESTAALLPYLHSELDPGRMRSMQLHLGGCKSCRDALCEVRRTADVVVPFYLPAYIHGCVPPEQRRTLEAHLVYCEFCRADCERLRQTSNEISKNLSQYQLTRAFRVRVLQEWKPHRVGKRSRYNQRGFADLLERAEAGNTFSYERHVDHFKDYAYLAAYLAVKDFHWAQEIAYQLFVRGMPVFQGELTQADFLQWLQTRTREIAEEGGWEQGDEESAEGLSGYTGSRKLRRHRMILALHESLPTDARLPFLLYYTQRLEYAEIAALLECSELEILTSLADSTRAATAALQADDQRHPTRRHPWERG